MRRSRVNKRNKWSIRRCWRSINRLVNAESSSYKKRSIITVTHHTWVVENRLKVKLMSASWSKELIRRQVERKLTSLNCTRWSKIRLSTAALNAFKQEWNVPPSLKWRNSKKWKTTCMTLHNELMRSLILRLKEWRTITSLNLKRISWREKLSRTRRRNKIWSASSRKSLTMRKNTKSSWKSRDAERTIVSCLSAVINLSRSAGRESKSEWLAEELHRVRPPFTKAWLWSRKSTIDVSGSSRWTCNARCASNKNTRYSSLIRLKES